MGRQVDGVFRQDGVIHRYSNHELDATYMSFVIMVCFFVSGMVDSVAFNSWSCFVNMQTGWSFSVSFFPLLSVRTLTLSQRIDC